MRNATQNRRTDIDGLRALAVLLVVLYHARLNDLSGGFIGVDIFFVISGYLIIPMIVSAQAAGNFTYGNFMLRRLRRLVPAMIPPLIFAVAAGVLLLGDERLKETLDSFLGAAIFFSNHVFLAASGYFATTAGERLLLHTWSLGVEFQFYAVTPFVLALCSGNRTRVTIVLVVLSGLSFALSEVLMTSSRESAFFMMAPRFWEFAVGGLAAIWITQPAKPSLWMSIAARCVGLALILWSALGYDQHSYFPGHGALAPVIGSVLLIAAPRTPRDPILWLMSSRPASWLGLRSYSIYLWHWPLIVTAVLYAERVNDALLVGMVLLSIAISALSYRFVERPPQENPAWRSTPRVVVVSVVLPAIALSLFSLQGLYGQRLRDGLPLAAFRQMYDLVATEKAVYFKTVHGSDDSAAMGYQCTLDTALTNDADAGVAEIAQCLSGSPFKAPVIVIGDSHGRDVFQALRRAFPSIDFVLYHQSGCAPATYRLSSDTKCFPGLEATLKAADENGASAVILASHWPAGGQSHLDETAAILKHLPLPVAVTGATPISRVAVPGMISHGYESRQENGALSVRYKAANSRADARAKETFLQAFAARNGWTFVPKLQHFCDADWCEIAELGDKMKLLFWDDQHLTDRGISFLAKHFADDLHLAEFLKRALSAKQMSVSATAKRTSFH